MPTRTGRGPQGGWSAIAGTPIPKQSWRATKRCPLGHHPRGGKLREGVRMLLGGALLCGLDRSVVGQGPLGWKLNTHTHRYIGIIGGFMLRLCISTYIMELSTLDPNDDSPP